MTDDESQQLDFLSDATELDAVTALLGDFRDDLPGKVARFRYVSNLEADFGSYGTMFFGGEVSLNSWNEAKSSFVHGNSLATIMLCQSLAENLLAGVLHLGPAETSRYVRFEDTLRRAEESRLLSNEDVRDLKRLSSIRNPLTHFRDVNDENNLSRRSMTTGVLAEELLRSDANFAISVAARLLSKKPFRVGA